MKVFIAGVTGATGQLLTSQLLAQGHKVIGYARNANKLATSLRDHENLSLSQGSLLEVSDEQLRAQLADVDGIASCLGHNLSRQGIWGQPRTLVKDSVQRLVALAPAHKIKFVLMNSNGVSRADEQPALADRLVIGLVRQAIPPHRDNELAANFLQNGLDKSNIEWSIVRPDNLKDAAQVSDYQAFATRQKGVIFNSGFTSRINVAHFMAQLLGNEHLWQQWRGQWPVLYNG